MDTMYDELIIKIGNKLCDRGKIYLTMVSKKFDQFKYKFMYCRKRSIRLNKIEQVPYFDNFEFVEIFDTKNTLPKHIKNVFYGSYSKKNMPPFVTYLALDYNFHESIKKGSLDGIGITNLTLGWKFNRSIVGCIPESVTHLTFSSAFDQSIKDCIPNFVTHLTFGDNFDQSIKDCIPGSVTHITFGRDFQQSIKNCLPGTLISLKMGYFFNNPINDCVPKSVTHLILGDHFNQSIIDCIPSRVTHLTFGGCFNRSIANSLPLSLTHLTFGCRFNQCIKNNIPGSVIYIRFGKNFDQLLDNDSIPLSVKRIDLHHTYYLKISDNIVSNVKISYYYKNTSYFHKN
jgi:hypothetical protein